MPTNWLTTCGTAVARGLQREAGMKTFPMFLKVEGRRIVILGGGEQAAQKARLALKTVADLVVVAPELDPELIDLVESRRARHCQTIEDDLFTDAALVFVATGCRGADAAMHAIAKRAGALVNVVDWPDLCDAMTPSIVDRDPVVVAIGTEGKAPVLGRRLKTRVEEMLHPRLGAYAELAGRMRAEVARRVPARDRRAFWRWVFGGAPWTMFSSGNEREAAKTVKSAIGSWSYSDQIGRLSIVLGATAPELLPYGMVGRMQEADLIYADADVPNAVLELARRDARRVQVSSGVADCKIASKSLRAASEPSRVVCLLGRRSPLSLPTSENVHAEMVACALPLRSQSLEAIISVEPKLISVNYSGI